MIVDHRYKTSIKEALPGGRRQREENSEFERKSLFNFGHDLEAEQRVERFGIGGATKNV